MSAEPKIKSNKDIETLKDCYLNRKMSTVDIEKSSGNVFGFYVSRGTIYKTLKKHDIPIRDKSTSVSRAMSTLDIDSSFISEDLIEWVDGFNLGDGYINYMRHRNYQNSRFVIGSSQHQWVKYAMEGFDIYDPSSAKVYQKIDEKHPNSIWESKTKTHPDIVVQAQRWYPDEKKHVPLDVRITPTSILLWYLGDGSFTYQKDGNIAKIRLATCSFDVSEIKTILIPKLEELGLRCVHEKSKNDIRVCADSIGKFFDIIGHKSPIPCYNHKFDIPKWLRLIRLSDIVQNNKEKWRAQYYYKTGQIECSKSPGGKMLLFTEDQAKTLKDKLADDRPR